MNHFNLLQWLNEHFERFPRADAGPAKEIQDVEVGGFGFPHHADFDSPSTNHFLHL